MLRDEVQHAFPNEDLDALAGNLIDGVWEQGTGPSFQVVAPSSGEVLASLNAASQALTQDAVR